MIKKGFTLAEVLITLAIIGIVAALTVPSVISNYQQQEFKTGLKKAVSVLNEAIQTNIAIDGETPYENSNLYAYLQRHMNILKKSDLHFCYNKSNGQGVELEDGMIDCYEAENAGSVENKIFYTTDGMRFELTPSDTFGGGARHFYLHETGIDAAEHKKGKSLYGDWLDETNIGWCGSYGLANNSNNTTNTPCVIMVDVNGDKKPNPPIAYATEERTKEVSWGSGIDSRPANQSFRYTYPSPSDKKLQDVFTIMITDEKAIPFGVVAQRAMYSK